MLWWGSILSVGGSGEASLDEMILPELLLSTSLISLAIFLWTFLQQWKSEDEECGPSSSIVSVSGPCSEEVYPPSPSPKDPGETGLESGPPSSESSVAGDRDSVAGDTGDTPQSSAPSTPRASGQIQLSRRQRKNRKREKEKDDLKVVKKTSKSPVLSRKNSDEKSSGELNFPSQQSSSSAMKNKKRGSIACKQYDKLGLEDHDIFSQFTSYLVSFDQMRQMGFPQDSSLYPGKAYIYRDPDFCLIFPDGNGSELDDGEFCQNKLDVNAKPFFPTPSSSNLAQPGGEDNAVEGFKESEGVGFKGVDDYSSDSEGSGDSSDKYSGEQGRKKSVEEISGVSLNVTAKEFVPGCPSSLHPAICQTQSAPSLVHSSSSTFSSQVKPAILSSISSSASSVSLKVNRESVTIDSKASDSRLVEGRVPDLEEEAVERRCVRCCKVFLACGHSGEYLVPEACSFHWGKLRSRGKAEPVFTCCGARASRQARGCSSNPCHVWSGLPSQGGIVGPLEGFVKTKHRKSYPSNGNFGVYGLDCEMCYTLHGLELAKVTVVGVDGRLVYETLVLPESDIIDHNTRFSGVSAKDLEKGPTKNLKEVQNDLMGFINADTVIVGHGLENDLRALKMIHGVVLDTSTVFPHFYGLPFRRSLRSLVTSYLKRDIQMNSWGHDSYEDARACIELMLWKTRKDNAASSRKIPRQCAKI